MFGALALMKTEVNTAGFKEHLLLAFRERSARTSTWVTAIPQRLIPTTLRTAKTKGYCWRRKPEKCCITCANAPIGRVRCEDGATTCYPGPYRVTNGFGSDRVANDSCRIKKSKTLGWGRSAESWAFGYASS